MRGRGQRATMSGAAAPTGSRARSRHAPAWPCLCKIAARLVVSLICRPLCINASFKQLAGLVRDEQARAVQQTGTTTSVLVPYESPPLGQGAPAARPGLPPSQGPRLPPAPRLNHLCSYPRQLLSALPHHRTRYIAVARDTAALVQICQSFILARCRQPARPTHYGLRLLHR